MNFRAQPNPSVNSFRFESEVSSVPLFALSNQKPHTLQVWASNGEPVIVINADGRIEWKGREVETDDEFKAAMLDLRAVLMHSKGIGS